MTLLSAEFDPSWRRIAAHVGIAAASFGLSCLPALLGAERSAQVDMLQLAGLALQMLAALHAAESAAALFVTQQWRLQALVPLWAGLRILPAFGPGASWLWAVGIGLLPLAFARVDSGDMSTARAVAGIAAMLAGQLFAVVLALAVHRAWNAGRFTMAALASGGALALLLAGPHFDSTGAFMASGAAWSLGLALLLAAVLAALLHRWPAPGPPGWLLLPLALGLAAIATLSGVETAMGPLPMAEDRPVPALYEALIALPLSTWAAPLMVLTTLCAVLQPAPQRPDTRRGPRWLRLLWVPTLWPLAVLAAAVALTADDPGIALPLALAYAGLLALDALARVHGPWRGAASALALLLGPVALAGIAVLPMGALVLAAVGTALALPLGLRFVLLRRPSWAPLRFARLAAALGWLAFCLQLPFWLWVLDASLRFEQVTIFTAGGGLWLVLLRLALLPQPALERRRLLPRLPERTALTAAGAALGLAWAVALGQFARTLATELPDSLPDGVGYGSDEATPSMLARGDLAMALSHLPPVLAAAAAMGLLLRRSGSVLGLPTRLVLLAMLLQTSAPLLYMRDAQFGVWLAAAALGLLALVAWRMLLRRIRGAWWPLALLASPLAVLVPVWLIQWDSDGSAFTGPLPPAALLLPTGFAGLAAVLLHPQRWRRGWPLLQQGGLLWGAMALPALPLAYLLWAAVLGWISPPLAPGNGLLPGAVWLAMLLCARDLVLLALLRRRLPAIVLLQLLMLASALPLLFGFVGLPALPAWATPLALVQQTGSGLGWAALEIVAAAALPVGLDLRRRHRRLPKDSTPNAPPAVQPFADGPAIGQVGRS